MGAQRQRIVLTTLLPNANQSAPAETLWRRCGAPHSGRGCRCWSPASHVRGYYDSNTWKWLLSGTDGALHRELWGPGVNDRREALHYIHRRILDHVTAQFSSSRARIVDFGCGVGTGVCYLAERIPADVHGITLSPRQVVHARHRADQRAGVLSGSCYFYEADFCRLPSTVVDSVAGADVVYAIESFVHAESAAAFIDAGARVLRPGRPTHPR